MNQENKQQEIEQTCKQILNIVIAAYDKQYKKSYAKKQPPLWKYLKEIKEK